MAAGIYADRTNHYTLKKGSLLGKRPQNMYFLKDIQGVYELGDDFFNAKCKTLIASSLKIKIT